jgi:Protein required for attachment to host cells
VTNKLLIVTDLGVFKAYKVELTPRHTPRLVPVEDIVLEDARLRVIETVTDMAGRHSGPTQKNWGAPLGDDHSLKLETKRRLIRQIAGHIQRLIQRTGSDSCWIAAHKEINYQILDELPKAIRARIEKNLALDLTKATQAELLEQFLRAAEA